jgi:hypothetical protein
MQTLNGGQTHTNLYSYRKPAQIKSISFYHIQHQIRLYVVFNNVESYT